MDISPCRGRKAQAQDLQTAALHVYQQAGVRGAEETVRRRLGAVQPLHRHHPAVVAQPFSAETEFLLHKV
uniref:hypothetical protein n=1 Tax=Streptomyces rimosus TaxID=1927 RepID=UPI001C730C90|nr:hypothetical protein [Streptomyces rimosus]